MKTSTKRLFLGLRPPKACLEQLADLCVGLQTSVPFGDDMRWLPEASWHLTLFFLGEVEVSALPELREGLGQVRFEAPIRQPLDELLLLPAAENFRVLAVGSPRVSPSLRVLWQAVGDQLRSLGFSLEARPYLPHLTLARARRSLCFASVPLLPVPPLELSTPGFTLYESQLSHGGAQYQGLAEFSVPS